MFPFFPLPFFQPSPFHPSVHLLFPPRRVSEPFQRRFLEGRLPRARACSLVVPGTLTEFTQSPSSLIYSLFLRTILTYKIVSLHLIVQRDLLQIPWLRATTAILSKSWATDGMCCVLTGLSPSSSWSFLRGAQGWLGWLGKVGVELLATQNLQYNLARSRVRQRQ